jgi:hypothetical protein
MGMMVLVVFHGSLMRNGCRILMGGASVGKRNSARQEFER